MENDSTENLGENIDQTEKKRPSAEDETDNSGNNSTDWPPTKRLREQHGSIDELPKQPQGDMSADEPSTFEMQNGGRQGAQSNESDDDSDIQVIAEYEFVDDDQNETQYVDSDDDDDDGDGEEVEEEEEYDVESDSECECLGIFPSEVNSKPVGQGIVKQKDESVSGSRASPVYDYEVVTQAVMKASSGDGESPPSLQDDGGSGGNHGLNEDLVVIEESGAHSPPLHGNGQHEINLEEKEADEDPLALHLDEEQD